MRRRSPTIALFGAAVLLATAAAVGAAPAAGTPPAARPAPAKEPSAKPDAGKPPAARMRRPRVVLVFENRSASASALALVSEAFDGALSRKGYEVIDNGEVTDFAEALKLPRFDPLPAGVAPRLLVRFRADQVLAVTVNFVLEAKARKRGPRASAAVGLSARLIALDERVRWRGSLGFIDSEAIRSGGHDDRAVAVATTIGQGSERLLLSFPRARAVPDEPARGSGPRFQLVSPKGTLDGRGANGSSKAKSLRPGQRDQ